MTVDNSLDFASLAGAMDPTGALGRQAMESAISRPLLRVVESPSAPATLPRKLDIVQLAKNRLAEVRAELSNLSALQLEEQQLTRLINAAEGL